ncbi:TerD family protein [Nocardia seriolae]|uniref:TerD family protein n=1 Tax=Nocardia seriolae TaxID=37332 RepID=UPI00051A6BAA|nr:TerD family protein [Nocardia seriolae]MTJ66887.1 stress protein [Nocardia seriolae]MTJ72544.1 stress protein [Nocardia seriolae]MTJ84870.1 stress protein [Nocardia seriolae]MTK28866.1 stress protein [Nocardia seriolae]MTK44948.1 stress protein [Nocardia seriolae]
MSTVLVKGQNGPLNVHDPVISVQVAAPADLSALLVTASGKVRSDADFVFFNQPNGPGVTLRPGPTGQPVLAVALSAIPAEIEQLRAVITLEDTASSFGQLPAPVAQVGDAAGNVLYEYRIEGLSSESIVIALELYRRQGEWKVRAVGQGYAGGFAALVTDHGVTVDDAPQTAPAPVPQSSPGPPPMPPGYQAPAPTGDFAPAGGYPPPVDQFASGTGYPPPAQYPPPAEYAPTGGYLPPAQSYPPPPAGQPAGYPPPPGYGAAPVEEVRDLPANHAVSLVKGQRINLRKEGGAALSYVKMGLGWDPVKRGGIFGNKAVDVDLDASVVLFSGTNPVDVVYYGSLTSKDGSSRHQGDNLTGEGEGDDEEISVDLSRVNERVTTLIFIVTSYKGHSFEQVANAYCRLVDSATNAELARYTLAGGMPFTGVVMAKMYRPAPGADWKLEALGEGLQAKHPGEAVPQLARFV